MFFQSQSDSSFSSGPSVPELCHALSPETILIAGLKTGVLLSVCTPGFTCDHCKQCWEERLACIYTAAGSIVHNTGDVILAEWVVDELLLSYTISRAAQCAFKILDAWSIQSGVHDLSHVPIKIAISAGSFCRVRQGDETSRVSVISGTAVDELRSVAELAEHGTIVISPEAWDLYAYDDFADLNVQCVGDEGAVKVDYINEKTTFSKKPCKTRVKTQKHSNSSSHLSKFSRLPQRAYLFTTAEREDITHQLSSQLSCCQDDADQMPADEAALSSTEIQRLALAHMHTMVPYEERVVKYASVIGHTFTLDMLRNVLRDMSEQGLITTLKALFGAGIFKCASSSEICRCNENSSKVLMEPEWTCQLISFCHKDQMETVHALMERNEHFFQEINAECADYLEKKAYRCGKCKHKRFVFGQKADRGSSNEHVLTFSGSQDDLSQNEMDPAEGNGINVENFLAKAKAVLTEAHDRMTAGSCECEHLVETVLFPRLRYWKCLGDVPRTFYYLVESASACVYLHQDARALEFLTEAKSILENLKEGKPAFPSAEPGDVQICQIQQAFVHRLTGQIHFKAGRLVEAEENFKSALTILRCSLPRSAVARSFKLMSEKMKRLHFRCRQFKIPQNSEQSRVQECIECLSFLWQIGCMRGQFRKASLAITVETNLAIQSGDSFKILYCTIDCTKYKQLKCAESKESHLQDFLCKTCALLLKHPEGQAQMSDLARSLAVINPCVVSV